MYTIILSKEDCIKIGAALFTVSTIYDVDSNARANAIDTHDRFWQQVNDEIERKG